MRLRILSDLHLEFFDGGRELPEVEADLIILAGDIHQKTEGLAWARQQFPEMPILYVLGNHEFYGTCMPLLREELTIEAKRYNIELLDNRAVTIGECVFMAPRYGLILRSMPMTQRTTQQRPTLKRYVTCPILAS